MNLINISFLKTEAKAEKDTANIGFNINQTAKGAVGNRMLNNLERKEEL